MIQTLLNFTGRQRLPLVLQTEAAECGLACVAMVAAYHGHQVDLNTLRRRYPVSLKGATLQGLIQVAGYLQLTSRPLRYELTDLDQLQLPTIVHWDMNHFVVLKTVSSHGIVVYDPAHGERRLSLAEASKHLTGVALELSPAESFTPKKEMERLHLLAFWKHSPRFAHALAQVFALSVVLEILVIAGPFYMQLTLDEVIARGDTDLLLVLALGFGLLAVIRVVSIAVRAWIILVVQNTLHFQIGARLFHHLIRLPLAYFEKRHIGDVLSRFTSIEPIRNLLAEGMIAAAADGLMALVTFTMMLVYSNRLALVVLAAFLAYGALRLALFRLLFQRNMAVIRSRAQESSTFIETIRAVQSLKLFNRESEREGQWLNRYAGVVNANARLGRAQIGFHMINNAIFGLENIITVYLAARLALDNALSVGMIFAFMSYKLQFIEKSVLLLEKALDYRILNLHFERLSDIALTPLERGHGQPLAYERELQGQIELRNVCFRYAEAEPLVLENVNLTVEPGQFVTIMGPSGGGKTTLVKIMLGLLEPTSGEVLIDGLPLSMIGARAYREHVGAVMQDDQLLSGSIADNICFFDPTFDQARMIRCAQLAEVHDEIMAMPMAYNSLIGDMGSSLSGGQKQRVLLARALYREPKILVLDEGTAHLDVEKEQHISHSLRTLSMTRISIAHRPEISDAADRVIRLERRGEIKGSLHDLSKTDGVDGAR